MTYSAVYCALIENRKQNPLPNNEYGEFHHIIPKSEGGSDDNDNLVKLSAREHYIAHLLLTKIYNDVKMYSALIYMKCTSKSLQRDFRFNSKLYQKMREEFANKISGENHWTQKHPEKVRRGFKYSLEHNKKLSEIGKTKVGKLNNFYGRHHSEETRHTISKKIREGIESGKIVYTASHLRGTTLSEEHKQKDREAMLGMKFWNNGKISVRARSCPLGFVAGRLKKKKTED